MKHILLSLFAAAGLLTASAHTIDEGIHRAWAPTPPMGWNSWDCYGAGVNEEQVKANADYMAEHLAPYGYEYIVVDIRWYVDNQGPTTTYVGWGQSSSDAQFCYDEWGRYIPSVKRFPSAAGGAGFKPLADYVHSKGLKFGIHLMRGLPRAAAAARCPLKGAEGVTLDMISSNDSICGWLQDNRKVLSCDNGQLYYNSIFELYAQWGVDFVKIDDLSRPYHTGEISMIRHAIDGCGRPMVLSLSPGRTDIGNADHVLAHANMWRLVDDMWDNWNQVYALFERCDLWSTHRLPGAWPDPDMLPLGHLFDHDTRLTEDEQQTMLTLYQIFKSPLIYGGDMPHNDEFTNALLTNRDALYVNNYSESNRQIFNANNKIGWMTVDPANGDRFAALFNTAGFDFINPEGALYRSGTISCATPGFSCDIDVALPQGSKTLALVVTDGGDSFSCDWADWINPVVKLKDGSTVDLTQAQVVRNTQGWGVLGVNKNIGGGTLQVGEISYDKGFGCHASSLMLFDLPDDVVSFQAMGALDHGGTSQEGNKSSVEFMVYNYDPTIHDANNVKADPFKQVACSGWLDGLHNRQFTTIEAPIEGAKKLWLVVTNGCDNGDWDRTDWANPVLVKRDGTEVNLTELLTPAETPINGWSNAKINKNNQGNTITIDGVQYQLGLGCNAPAQFVFNLPEGHDFVTFKSIVGLDDDVIKGPDAARWGATVEARVFVEDPTPTASAPVGLDLTLLGLEVGQSAEITDLWNGTKEGTFKDDEFVKTYNTHASGFYRIAPQGRANSAEITLTVNANKSDDTVNFNATVSDGANDDAYVQILMDGNVIATMPAAATVNYSAAHLPAGAHSFTARYSGTPAVASCESQPVNFNVESAGIAAVDYRNVNIEVIPGALKVVSSEHGILNIYNTMGVAVKSAPLEPGVNTISLPAGLYAVAGQTFMIR